MRCCRYTALIILLTVLDALRPDAALDRFGHRQRPATERPSCRTTSSGWIEEERKRKSNAFEAASQESAVLKCRAVRHRTSSLTSRPIDPLPFSSLIPRCIPYDLPFKKEGDGLARQLFRNRLSTSADHDLVGLARVTVGRNFLVDEWELYFPGKRYHKTFAELPSLQITSTRD